MSIFLLSNPMPDRVRVHTMHSAQGRDLEPIFGYLSQSKIFSANFRQTWTTVLVTMYGFHSEKNWKKLCIKNAISNHFITL